VLYDCATIAGASSYGSLEFDARWLEETVVTPRHGIFHYDRDQGPDGYDPDGVTWDNTTTDDWNKIGMIPYDVTNISTMSLLLAGNSTVEFTTSMCGPEGCPYTLPVCRTCGTRMFKWTTGDSDLDAINWNVTDDPSVDVPSQYWQGTIWDDWTVVIDGETPVVNRLVVRGTLIFQPDAKTDVALRAHYVTVDGGRVIMGNETDPIDNETTATLWLHGDKYLSTIKKDGEWTQLYNFKRLDLNGNFSMFGAPVTTHRKLGANAFAGATAVNLSAPAADWRSTTARAPGPRRASSTRSTT